MSETTDLPIRIVILDSFTLVRNGVRLVLEKQPGFSVVGEAGDSQDGLEVVARQKPDMILLKLHPPGNLDLDVISQLISTWKKAHIILMTTTEDLQVSLKAVQEGVLGVVSMLEPPEVLIKAIEKVHSGEVWIGQSILAQFLTTTSTAYRSRSVDTEGDRIKELSNREREVIHLIGQGLKNQQIASVLHISETTVRHHLTSIYSKLGVSDRLELLVFAHRLSLV